LVPLRYGERMKLRLSRDRIVLGFRGLALLRGWPFEDPDRADEQVAEIRRLAALDRDGEVYEVDALDVGDAYAGWACTYDQPNALIAVEEPVVRAFLVGMEPGRALDVAAGTGRHAAILRDLGHRTVAVDVSTMMLERARANRRAHAYARADMLRLPIRDSSVDVVVCGLALTHAGDLRSALAELARVVRPDGRVVLSDIHPVAVATGAHAFFRREDGTRGVTRNHLHWPSDYVEAFVGAGLEIERSAEPRFERAQVEEVPDPEVRRAAGLGLLGLPFALVWQLRRRR
jgi:ubiquinone/menaquinone biosynthesis C-methylase UbiE